jgi:cytochrome b561
MMGVQKYSRPAVWLHWIVAVLMVVNVCLALYVDYAPEDWARPIIDTHKSVGLTVLGLAILRLSWRLSHAPPPLPSTYPRWERLVAHGAHGLLYALIFLLPLTGLAHDSAWKAAPTHPLRWFGLFEVPRIGWLMSQPEDQKDYWHDLFGLFHTFAGYALYVLVALHILGALKHQFIDKQPELQRMAP